MRLSTFQIHNQASEQLQQLAAQTAKTQQQISQGKKLINPSDDPVGAARVIGLNQELAAREQFVTNTEAADVHLALEDSVLQQITNVIQRVQELTIQAGSGVQTAEDRVFVAVEIEERFEELMALANTLNSNGQYIFGGFKGDEPPFGIVDNKVVYNGDAGQRQIQVDRGQYVAVTDSGEDLFMGVDSFRFQTESQISNSVDGQLGSVRVVSQELAEEFYPDKLLIEFNSPAEAGGVNNYSVLRLSDRRPVEGLVNIPYATGGGSSASGVEFRLTGSPVEGDQFTIAVTQRQSVFSAVNTIAQGLTDINAITQPEAFQELIDTTLVDLNNATTSILETRAKIGARLNTMSAVKDLHQDLTIQLQEVRSSIEDVDFAEAVSDLAYQSFVLEAAQQSFVRINGLSLFNRL